MNSVNVPSCFCFFFLQYFSHSFQFFRIISHIIYHMFIFTETKTEADSAGEIQKNTSGAYNLSLSSKMYDKPIQKSCNIQTSARVNVGQIQIVFTVVHTSCVQMHIKTG